MKKNFVIIISFLLLNTCLVRAQEATTETPLTNEDSIAQEKSSSLFRKGDSWIELRTGINFDAKRLDIAYNPDLFRDVPTDREVDQSYFAGISYNEFKTNTFMIGGELSYAYQNAPTDEANLSSVSQLGISINMRKYFLPIKDKVMFFANLNSGYFFFELDDTVDNRENYFRAGLDFGVSYLPNERLQFSLFMPDIATFVTSRRNFDGAYTGGINLMHNKFYKYPMIGVSYRLENIKHIYLYKDEEKN